MRALNKRPDTVDDLLIKEIIEESIRSNYDNVIVLHTVELCISFLWVITSRATLVWKIKAVRLLNGPVYCFEVLAAIAHSKQKISRVTQVARVDHRRFFVETGDNTGRAPHLSCHLGSFHAQ